MSKVTFLCAACRQPIEKDCFEALGKYWHKEHLKCGHCHQELNDQNFNERDGVPYCKKDYDNLFTPMCGRCNTAVTGGVAALGKHWHTEHFQCGHCRQVLGTQTFIQRDGVPYCKTDYHNLFSPKCGHCNAAITGDSVTALGKTWHPDHFFCIQCKKPFGKNLFSEKDGKPYCKEDYLDLFAPKCAGCKMPIEVEHIIYEGGRWHNKCFAARDQGSSGK